VQLPKLKIIAYYFNIVAEDLYGRIYKISKTLYLGNKEKDWR
jgi:hypothetical protein